MIQSGYQLMVKNNAARRPTLNNIWNEIFPSNEPRAKSLIEIRGAPGTGKRTLLCQLMALASLPEIYGGKYSQVIFLDLVHKFDICSFMEYIKKSIENNSITESQMSYETIISECMESILHLPCYSLDEFDFAFEEIEELLWEHKRVALLAIHGLETFYWDECYNQLQRMSTHYKKLVQCLKQLCETHNICCAYTMDANYLLAKSKMTSLPQSLIDYKLNLIENIDGQRFLNDIPIQINYNGIEILSEN